MSYLLLKLQSVDVLNVPGTVEKRTATSPSRWPEERGQLLMVWADALMTRMLAQRNRLDIGGTTDPGH
jgi:hypothetical protein